MTLSLQENYSMIIAIMEHFEALYPETSRSEEIEKILNFIKEGNSVQLISLPGVGRSNLLGFLSYNTKIRLKHLGVKQKNFHFVNINLSEVKEKPTAEVFKFIFLELWDSLKDRKYEYDEVKKILKESLDFNDEMAVFQGLKKAIELLTLEKGLTIVFLFDRFETYVKNVDSSFFSNLRALRNKAKYKFSAVFSLNRPLENILESNALLEFHEFIVGHHVFLPLYDKSGVDFRISYLEKSLGKKLEKKDLDSILTLTGGHGKLTRLCSEAVLSGTKIEDIISDGPVKGALLEIHNALTPSEINLLEAKQGNEYLEKVELFKNGRIGISLFEDFIKLHKPKTKFDLESLSENLSSLEYKLLKFFTQNSGRIIGREEIVQNVWQDNKSIQGVTDQALDQLIFRLRKKIEADPNNPTLLTTVKGRGFKFVN